MRKIISLNYLDEDVKRISEKLEGKKSAKFFYQIDPIFYNIKHNMVKSRFSSLKQGRIIIDKASLLIGVIDYYGILEENEVFIQLSAMESIDDDLYNKGCYVQGGVVTGDVVISRSPSLHPGDIRKFKAVNDPVRLERLSHLKDVVVFSQKGNRPVANCLSGGDLDGDLFLVIWDERFHEFEEYSPMSYQSLTPEHRPNGCDYKVIREFLAEYILNDNLGIVAHLHMEHYDKEADGVRSNPCLKLAKQFRYVLMYY